MKEIEDLIRVLSRLPGLGPRSARRAVLHMIKKKETVLSPLLGALQRTLDTVKECDICGNIDTHSPCSYCQDTTRDTRQLCVIEDVSDLWALARSHAYKGYFHVLGGVLSPVDGVRPEDLRIAQLLNRVKNGGIEEIILATNVTVEGQSTAHYITEKLQDMDVKITRLAHGLPVGGELDYMDDGTIHAALEARTEVD